MIGLLVCGVTYLLRAVDFAPLRSLISLEDRVYNKVIPLSLELRRDAHPVIFIAIDDEAMRRWGASQSGAAGTARAMLAKFTSIIRGAHASIIFLDFDLRNHLEDDDTLRKELAKSSPTRVLLPKSFSSSVLPPCETQASEKAPIELETVFDDAIKAGSVASVHSAALLGAYGLVDGTCSFYQVRVGEKEELVFRPAAMTRAVELARDPSGIYDHVPPRIIVTHWWIQKDTELLHDRAGRLAYARIEASLYVQNNDVDVKGLDLKAFENAIVIVGSTHRWSDDIHETPVGDLPGAIIHANLGLELQSQAANEAPLAIQFLLDILIILLSAIITIPLCWYPFYKSSPSGAQPPIQKRIPRLVRECIIILFVGALFAFGILILAEIHGDFVAGWRFGMLSFILSAALVLLIELITIVADATAEFAEAVAIRFSRPCTDETRNE
jgi:CHASE2 domain-containing sensor protein